MEICGVLEPVRSDRESEQKQPKVPVPVCNSGLFTFCPSLKITLRYMNGFVFFMNLIKIKHFSLPSLPQRMTKARWKHFINCLIHTMSV